MIQQQAIVQKLMKQKPIRIPFSNQDFSRSDNENIKKLHNKSLFVAEKSDKTENLGRLWEDFDRGRKGRMSFRICTQTANQVNLEKAEVQKHAVDISKCKEDFKIFVGQELKCSDKELEGLELYYNQSLITFVWDCVPSNPVGRDKDFFYSLEEESRNPGDPVKNPVLIDLSRSKKIDNKIHLKATYSINYFTKTKTLEGERGRLIQVTENLGPLGTATIEYVLTDVDSKDGSYSFKPEYMEFSNSVIKEVIFGTSPITQEMCDLAKAEERIRSLLEEFLGDIEVGSIKYQKKIDEIMQKAAKFFGKDSDSAASDKEMEKLTHQLQVLEAEICQQIMETLRRTISEVGDLVAERGRDPRSLRRFNMDYQEKLEKSIKFDFSPLRLPYDQVIKTLIESLKKIKTGIEGLQVSDFLGQLASQLGLIQSRIKTSLKSNCLWENDSRHFSELWEKQKIDTTITDFLKNFQQEKNRNSLTKEKYDYYYNTARHFIIQLKKFYKQIEDCRKKSVKKELKLFRETVTRVSGLLESEFLSEQFLQQFQKKIDKILSGFWEISRISGLNPEFKDIKELEVKVLTRKLEDLEKEIKNKIIDVNELRAYYAQAKVEIEELLRVDEGYLPKAILDKHKYKEQYTRIVSEEHFPPFGKLSYKDIQKQITKLKKLKATIQDQHDKIVKQLKGKCEQIKQEFENELNLIRGKGVINEESFKKYKNLLNGLLSLPAQGDKTDFELLEQQIGNLKNFKQRISNEVVGKLIFEIDSLLKNKSFSKEFLDESREFDLIKLGKKTFRIGMQDFVSAEREMILSEIVERLQNLKRRIRNKEKELIRRAKEKQTRITDRLRNGLRIVRGWMPQNLLKRYQKRIDDKALHVSASTSASVSASVPAPAPAPVSTQAAVSSSTSRTTSGPILVSAEPSSVPMTTIGPVLVAASSSSASAFSSTQASSTAVVLSSIQDPKENHYGVIQNQVKELENLEKEIEETEEKVSQAWSKLFKPVLRLRAIGDDDIDLKKVLAQQSSDKFSIYVLSLDNNGNEKSLEKLSSMPSVFISESSTTKRRAEALVTEEKNIVYYEVRFDESAKQGSESMSSASSVASSSSSSSSSSTAVQPVAEGQTEYQGNRMRIYMQDFLKGDNLHIKGEVEVNFDDQDNLTKAFRALKQAGFAAVELGVLLRESRSDKQKALFKLCCKASAETGLPLKIDGKIFEPWDLKDSKKGETIKIPSAADKRFPYFWRACTGIPISEVSEVVKQTQRCCIAAD